MLAVGFVAALAAAGVVAAQGETAGDAAIEAAKANASGLLAVGAGLAVGIAGLGTGLAQKDIGAAAVGAIAEDSKFFGRGLTLMVIPETIVLFGLVIAFLLMGKISF
ncbi:MAG: hypothetical protein HY556_05610 [Euryarchaeota archaeon]|nr:hypothetical protein [Euryarchaeota archaeon]